MAGILVRPWRRGKWTAMPGTKRLRAGSPPRGQTTEAVLLSLTLLICTQEFLHDLLEE